MKFDDFRILIRNLRLFAERKILALRIYLVEVLSRFITEIKKATTDARVMRASHWLRIRLSKFGNKITRFSERANLISDGSAEANSPASVSIRAHFRIGLVIIFVLVFGLGGWASTMQLSGAVIAPGQLVVDSNVKKVQHPTGGVVAELFVQDGSEVKANDVLIRLDDTQTRANVGILAKSLDELSARQARDEAERDNTTNIEFPADLIARESDPDAAKLLDGERKLFITRRTAREGQKSQLKERIEQLKEEVRGVEAQQKSKDQQIEWIGKELVGVKELWEKNLVPIMRMSSLERESARLLGERGQAVAQIAQAKGKINETELQIIQIDQDMRTEVGKDLADIRGKKTETSEKLIAAQDLLKRIEIRSPQDGKVFQLAVHTVGGVITAGEPIMLIVPERDALSVEARIQPQDIDQVRYGQTVALKFSAFNQRTTPEIEGSINRISADVSQDQKSGISFYTIRVSVPNSEVVKLDGLTLIPGMPVETFIQTTPRTIMSYLIRPLRDQLARAFREK